ncbi:MAG TPA: endolytic transglycosylase MltG [Dermatophilaceae bacterium]|nr:endolytic transglycosylase MltG [Dermatophilaceae bacterium]
MTDRLDEAIFDAAGQTRRRRRSSRRRRVVTIVAAGALMLGGGGYAVAQWSPILSGLTGARDYEGSGAGEVSIVIKVGDSGRDIADNLQQAGVVRTAGAFESALDRTPGAELQPGTYRMRREMSAAAALTLLRDPLTRAQIKVTVPEGLWRDEVFALLVTQTRRPLAEYQAAAKDPGLLGLPTAAGGNLEGYLFPSTYSFEPSDTAEDHLRAMVGQTVRTLNDLAVPQAAWHRTIIVASLIEGEARLDADRGKVARVIENRLAAKQNLQLDSTVSYGVKRRSITTTDAERAARNGYGTYTHPGLPVGPIGNPGLASIKAALAPTPGGWRYFVTVNPDTGLTKFAVTAAEHEANVKLFQAWCRTRPGTC